LRKDFVGDHRLRYLFRTDVMENVKPANDFIILNAAF